MKKTMLILGIAAMMAACNQAGSDSAHESNPADVAEAGEGSTDYKVNLAESVLNWRGEKITGAFHVGTVQLKSGTINIKNGMITAGDFVVDMNSINNTDQEDPEKVAKLEGHLKSPDFFEVSTYPTASFAVSTVTADSVTGNMTIKGITHPITIPYSLNTEGDKLKISSSFYIDRAKWNVQYGSGSFFDGLGDDLIKDEIKFDIELRADKKM